MVVRWVNFVIMKEMMVTAYVVSLSKVHKLKGFL